MKDEKAMQKKLEELMKKGPKLTEPEKDALKQEMLDRIWHGGAWFTTRPHYYLKIAYSEADGCLFARECVVKTGAAEAPAPTVEGGAYTFGTDWFDISFHGRSIDIYCDPDTFKSWNIEFVPGRGTVIAITEGDNEAPAPTASAKTQRLLKFCAEADRDALADAPAVLTAYHISGAPFAKTIALAGAQE
jgi:hypothetical protein